MGINFKRIERVKGNSDIFFEDIGLRLSTLSLLRRMQMNKEYFLTAPLLKAAGLIDCGDCIVSLRGQDATPLWRVQADTQLTIHWTTLSVC